MTRTGLNLESWRVGLLASVAAVCMTGAPVMAQDTLNGSQQNEEEESDEGAERIVVTGSRVRRDSFTSTAPLQVISAEAIQEAGLVDTGEILRSTTVVQGAQLDAQINSTLVSNAGPGGQAVSLRGLAADRTLVLINGRRFAPAGVEGAPSFPDVSLIPSSMIERIDILLDGASSVYGSDAVAGVTNIILRDEFDGLQFEGFYSAPDERGGEQSRLNFIVGGQGDRTRYMFSAEYLRNEELRGNERDWMFTDGEACGIELDIQADGSLARSCGNRHLFQSNVGVALNPFSIFVGFPGISAAESDLGLENIVSSGFPDAPAFNDQARNNPGVQGAYELPASERTTAFLTFAHELGEILPGTEFFTEFSFSNRQTAFNSGPGQFTVDFDDNYPFNPFGGAPGSILLQTPWDVTLDVSLDQYRLFSGFQGDLGFVGFPSWDYEVFAGYTRSQGFSRRDITLEENLNLTAVTTEIDGTGVATCGLDTPSGFFQSRTAETCLPINFFQPGAYAAQPDYVEGNDEVTAWLRGFRDINTVIDQRILGGYVTGPVWELPAGDLSIVFGAEWREDALETQASDVASRGLGLNFFQDRESNGDVELWEIYGEAIIPVLSGLPFAEELTFETAARYIDHEFYGENSTWSFRASYSPVDFLTFRGTAGTSFRAPNLRELFLGGQSGFASFSIDPCGVPLTALDGGGNYDPTLDPRAQIVLDNCTAEGVDPTSLGLQGTSGVEVFRSGNTGLDPEESEAFSLGFVFEQPFTEAFDLRFGLNWYDITVENSVLVPNTGFILNQCYNSTNFPNDPFCTRRVRDVANTGFLLEVDATPFNVAENSSTGFDYNAAFATDFTAFSRPIQFSSDVVVTQSDSIEQITDLDGVITTLEQVGLIGSPEWRATANSRLRIGDNLSLFWRARYIGEQDPGSNASASASVQSEAEIYRVEDIWYHDVSASWVEDSWVLRVGVNNLFDQDPPQIDEDITSNFSSAGSVSTRSVPLGVGYDQIGRRVFINVSRRF